MDLTNFINKWKQNYDTFDETLVSETLTEAKSRKTRFYRNICTRHGQMLFYTKDNSCPICCKVARDHRNKNDWLFNRSRMLFNEIKQRAKEKCVIFDITKDDIRLLYGTVIKCPVFDIDICYNTSTANDNSPSIDRLVPTDGYTKNNISLISNRANRLKNNGTPEEHIKIAYWQLISAGYNHKHTTDIISSTIYDIISV